MWKQFIKDYLSFSRTERNAVVVLLVLIALVSALPYAWPRQVLPKNDEQELTLFKRQVSLLNKTGKQVETNRDEDDFPNTKPIAGHGAPHRATLFYFDPNRATADQWKQLGLHARTIKTIQRYLEKGGRFREAADLGKIYGLHRDELERLMPWVRITENKDLRGGDSSFFKPARPRPEKPAHSLTAGYRGAAIDINAADTLAWIGLPGIGSRLAARIVGFRDRLGGFHSVGQVGETYGLRDSVFQIIRPWLRCDNPAPKKININAATAGELKQHPYIRWNLANTIVQYRQQHGNYASPKDLEKIELVTPELLEKLIPYLAVKE